MPQKYRAMDPTLPPSVNTEGPLYDLHLTCCLSWNSTTAFNKNLDVTLVNGPEVLRYISLKSNT